LGDKKSGGLMTAALVKNRVAQLYLTEQPYASVFGVETAWPARASSRACLT
jgi:hypothetical protein